MCNDRTSLEQSLKHREGRLNKEKRYHQLMQEDYEQISSKSERFLNDVSELMRNSEERYFFQDLESQHYQTTQKVRTYFQEEEAYLRQKEQRLEDDKEHLQRLKKKEEDKDGR